MPLSIQEVEHIARLARLELSPAEVELFREQLSAVLDYAARLQTVPGSAPAAESAPASTALRPDEPLPGLEIDQALANAPKLHGRRFEVPPVFEDSHD